MSFPLDAAIMRLRNIHPRSSPGSDRDEPVIVRFRDPRPYKSVAEIEYPSALEPWQVIEIVDNARCRPKFRGSSSTFWF